MTSQPGSQVLLKIGNGGSPSESFTTIGGLVIAEFSQNNRRIDVTTKDSGGWQEFLAGGVRSMSLKGSGRFANSAAEETLRAKAMGNLSANYEFHFANGDKLAGSFLVTSYQRGGAQKGVEGFSLALVSSGAVAFTAAG